MKITEWQNGSGRWYASDVTDLANNSGDWIKIYTALGLTAIEYITKLKEIYGVDHMQFIPAAASKHNRSMLLFSFPSKQQAHQYALDCNRGFRQKGLDSI